MLKSSPCLIYLRSRRRVPEEFLPQPCQRYRPFCRANVLSPVETKVPDHSSLGLLLYLAPQPEEQAKLLSSRKVTVPEHLPTSSMQVSCSEPPPQMMSPMNLLPIRMQKNLRLSVRLLSSSLMVVPLPQKTRVWGRVRMVLTTSSSLVLLRGAQSATLLQRGQTMCFASCLYLMERTQQQQNSCLQGSMAGLRMSQLQMRHSNQDQCSSDYIFQQEQKIINQFDYAVSRLLIDSNPYGALLFLFYSANEYPHFRASFCPYSEWVAQFHRYQFKLVHEFRGRQFSKKSRGSQNLPGRTSGLGQRPERDQRGNDGHPEAAGAPQHRQLGQSFPDFVPGQQNERIPAVIEEDNWIDQGMMWERKDRMDFSSTSQWWQIQPWCSYKQPIIAFISNSVSKPSFWLNLLTSSSNSFSFRQTGCSCSPFFSLFFFFLFSFSRFSSSFSLSWLYRTSLVDSWKQTSTKPTMVTNTSSSMCLGMQFRKAWGFTQRSYNNSLVSFQQQPPFRFTLKQFIISSNRLQEIILVTFRHPRSPIRPPTTVPTKAPTKGIGIKVWPIRAPTIEVPTVAPVRTTKPVISDNFLLSVLKWLEKILQKAWVNEPAAMRKPTMGMIIMISSIDLERMALLERSLKKSEAVVYFFMMSRQRPMTPSVLVKFSKGMPFNNAQTG